MENVAIILALFSFFLFFRAIYMLLTIRKKHRKFMSIVKTVLLSGVVFVVGLFIMPTQTDNIERGIIEQTDQLSEVQTEIVTESETQTETEIVTESETQPETEITTESETQTEIATEPETENKPKQFSLIDTVEVKPIMNGLKTEQVGEVSIARCSSDQCTKEVLEDFYFNYVDKNDHNFDMVLFTDKNDEEGIHIIKGLIEVGSKFEKDGNIYMVSGHSDDAVYFAPDTDGKTLKEIFTEEETATEAVTETEKETEFVYTDSDTVMKAQEALNALGYDCGVADGMAGKATAAAVMAYADSKGLTSSDGKLTTGIVDSLTKDKAAYDKAHPQTEAQTERQTERSVPLHDYVVNANNDKLHETWCGSVNQMKESNKRYISMTREEAVNRYVPCKNCNP